MRIRARLIGFIAFFQSVLFLLHFFLYETWKFSPAGNDPPVALWLKIVVGVLSISFLATSLLAFRYTNVLLRVMYRVAAAWLGWLSFSFFAACMSWVIFGIVRLAGMDVNFHRIVEVLFGASVVLGFSGLVNAGWTRIRRITVRLENLPQAWRGRRAALLSDLHLGHVRNGRFLRRIVAKTMREKPDVVFVAGDLYDGTAIDTVQAAEPLPALEFGYSRTKKWKQTACSSSACLTSTPPTTSICVRSCSESVWTGIAPAFF